MKSKPIIAKFIGIVGGGSLIWLVWFVYSIDSLQRISPPISHYRTIPVSLPAVKKADTTVDDISDESRGWTVMAPTLNVRTTPSLKSKISFRLFQTMDIWPLEGRQVGFYEWLSFSLGDRDYWVVSQNLKSGKSFLASPDSPIAAPPTDLRFQNSGYSVLVEKSKRILTLRARHGQSLKKMKQYPIGLSPLGDKGAKQKSGDRLTPEGFYAIVYKNPQSKFGDHPMSGEPLPSFMLNYPNRYDAWRGLKEGIITLNQYNAINQAIDNDQPPPLDTRLGGLIMIHGGGAEKDWTKGCIAVNDQDLVELLDTLEEGTPVQIVQ